MYPAHYSSIFAAEKSGEDPHISDCEAQYYGTDHAIVGELLAKQWGFPPELAYVIRHHHDSLDSDVQLVGVVSMADMLARTIGIGYDGDSADSADIAKVQSKLGMSAEEYENMTAFASRERVHIEEFFQTSS
jgi:HD-like signal output (HDOD) protein